jgi:hypothetical protein
MSSPESFSPAESADGENISTQELIALVRDSAAASSKSGQNVATIPEAIFWRITDEQARALAEIFGSFMFMRLPRSEVRFFEWLRATDEEVWNNLWGEDIPEGESEEPYLVGVGVLPEMLREARGFPICDLTRQPNFFFSIKNFNAEEIKPLIDATLQRVEERQTLSLQELFLLEIRRAPIDAWRFAYMYGAEVGEVKRLAAELVEDGLLRYAAEREDMSDFLSWE